MTAFSEIILSDFRKCVIVGVKYYICSVQSAVCRASTVLLLLMLAFSLCPFFYIQLLKTRVSQPEKFLSLVTTLTLPHWQKRGCEENDHQSQTNLHLSKVS